jgi:hypothetical protein
MLSTHREDGYAYISSDENPEDGSCMINMFYKFCPELLVYRLFSNNFHAASRKYP